jgi:ferredoxin
MTRYETLREIFLEKKCFKLVCGAGNEDLLEVEKLATIFTIAGAHMLDLSANVDVVKAALKGIENAYIWAPSVKKKIAVRPYLNVSIGIKGDPHVRKGKINMEICTGCGVCRESCAREAINEVFIVEEYRCIGCGECETVCSAGAVEFIHRKADFVNILPECVQNGVETMELHAVSKDNHAVREDWLLLNSLIRDNFVSVCLDRSLLSNRDVISRIRELYEITGERLIVQADGIPMSGEGDDFNTTLQTIACADIVQKSGIPVMILLSGGTNSKTGILAKQCGVKAHGVAIGSFARKIMKPYTVNNQKGFSPDMLTEAVRVADDLIRVNMEAISD